MSKRKRDPLLQFHVPLAIGGNVDEERGIIRGVSVITSGVTALGHNIEVDDTTLLEMKAAADSRPGGKVPVKWNHKTGADEVCGYLVNFRVADDKLKADWHLLDTHPRRDQALELATKMPDGVGLSASFFGKNEKKGAKEFARCKRLQSVDLVAAPAANPDGLFEEVEVDSGASAMSDNNGKSGQAGGKETPVDFAAMMTLLQEQGESQREFQQSVSDRLTALEEGVVQPEHFSEPDDGHEEEIPTEFASVPEAITYLSQRLDAAEDAREQERQEQAFEEISNQFEALLELNERLEQQNEFMANALKELQDASGHTVEFAAGNEGEDPTVKITGPSDGGPELTAFEARVVELQRDDDKEHGEALLLAQKEDPKRYEQHLEAKGAFSG